MYHGIQWDTMRHAILWDTVGYYDRAIVMTITTDMLLSIVPVSCLQDEALAHFPRRRFFTRNVSTVSECAQSYNGEMVSGKLPRVCSVCFKAFELDST